MKAFCLLSAALLVPLGAALAAPSATIEPDAPLRSDARIASELGISERTVQGHRAKIYRKFVILGGRVLVAWRPDFRRHWGCCARPRRSSPPPAALFFTHGTKSPPVDLFQVTRVIRRPTMQS